MQSEGFDISLRAQTGEPVLLQLLRLFLPQPRLDIGPHVFERFHFAALARFHFQDVMVAAYIHDFADRARLLK